MPVSPVQRATRSIDDVSLSSADYRVHVESGVGGCGARRVVAMLGVSWVATCQ